MNFESRNPATGELLGTYPEHDKAEIEVRLQRAWDGWRHWSRTQLQERIAFLTRLAELLEERAETYGRQITAEMGKPLADSIFEIKKSAWAARHLAETGEAYLKPQPVSGIPAEIVFESLGPIFSVQPWNVPFWQVLRFFNTTALVGNTALIKHAESVQGCAEALETLVRDAGGPKDFMSTLQSRLRRVRPSSPIRVCGPSPSPAASAPAAPLRRKQPGSARERCWNSAVPIHSSCWRTPISRKPCS
jgi:succinate-semialdehyde dehydrogenase/glutarate-semialdehyde dehydrogenase/succinate-semialdehyde dehydrogenase